MDRDEINAYRKLGREISETAQDRDTFKSSILGLFENLCTNVEGYFGPEEMKKEREDQLSRYEIARLHLATNVDMIYDYSESPIEILFLCNFLITSLRFSPFFLAITTPIVVDMTIKVVSEYHKKLRQIRKDVRKSKFPEIWHVADMLTTHTDLKKVVETMLPKHLKAIGDGLIDNLGYLEHGLGRSFHVSLQPSFEHIRVEGKSIRPDMVLWIPTRPDFKLIVECDGYEYHSDKETFSKDRIRDRVLQQQGYQVFRFSGREIVQNATLKVNEFVDYLFALDEKFGLDLEKSQDVMNTFREDVDELENSTPSSHRSKKKPSMQQKKWQRHAQRQKR